MGTPRGRHDQRDPLARLKQLRPEDIGPEAFRAIVLELEVHQEELAAQNTQLIETQHALEQSRDRYFDLYDFAPIGFMTLTESGVINDVNLTGATLLGRERNRVLGVPFNVFVAKDSKLAFADHLRESLQLEHASATVELRLKAGGSPQEVQLITRPYHGNIDGKPGLQTALVDITHRKHLERQRRDAEDSRDKLRRDGEVANARAEAKDHFLAMLSHELRTPLTPIMATLSNDRLLALAPEPLRAALQTMKRNLDLEVRLIDDLLDVTRIARNRLVLSQERVSVHAIVRQVIEMLDQEIGRRGLSVTMALEAPAEWVIGDPVRLQQVFWNLVGNAIKFSRRGGCVTVTSAAGPPGQIQVRVTDSGIGMDQDVVSSINDEESTASLAPIQSSGGLGLGLVICRGVIKGHGGTLLASSAGIGRGSTFIVQIPIAADLEKRNEPSRLSEQREGDTAGVRRILLVEDHPDSADTLSMLLTYHDYDVYVAHTVEEAIAAATDGLFDLVISDVRLPDGSGLDLLPHLQSNRPIQGIAISGFGSDDDLQRSRRAGFSAHLTKPVDFERLLDAIQKVSRAAR